MALTRVLVTDGRGRRAVGVAGALGLAALVVLRAAGRALADAAGFLALVGVLVAMSVSDECDAGGALSRPPFAAGR
jgi:hypothetical protein